MNLSSISGFIGGESNLYRYGNWNTPNASYYYYSGEVLPSDAYYVVVGPDFEYRYEAESLLPPYPLYITANDFNPGNYTLEVRYYDNTTYATEVAASFSFVISNY